MSDDAKFAEAYQALGKYFSEFSALERELGEAVKAVLNLQGHDAADNYAVGNHVVVILAPLAGWARDRGALEDQVHFQFGDLRRVQFQ
jgi:hypothetical protein